MPGPWGWCTARDTKLGREVAIKLLPDHRVDDIVTTEPQFALSDPVDVAELSLMRIAGRAVLPDRRSLVDVRGE